MPSFAGFWRRTPVSPDLIGRLASRLHAPPGHKVRIATASDNRAGLLAVLPEGAEFGASASGTVRCAFEGELYNRPDVRKFVVSRTRALKSESAAELVANMWEAKGRDTMMSLRGSFAMAVWDEANDLLFLARDAMGHRPLYVVEAGGGWAFGSEIGPVAAFPETKPSLETAALDHFLAFHAPPQPLTLLRGVHKVPPAGWIEIQDGHFEDGRYWTPTFYDASGQNPDEIAQHAFSYLFESVKAHTRDLDPPTVFLEGDPYSAVLAGLANLAKRGRLRTFSFRHRWVPEEAAFGAQLVARRFGSDHREEESEASIASLVEALAAANAEALPIGRMAPAMLLAGSVQASSVPAVLAAAGGELYMRAGRRPVAAPLSTLGLWRRAKESTDAANRPLSKEVIAEFEGRMIFSAPERDRLYRGQTIPAMDAVGALCRRSPSPGDASVAAYADAIFFLPELILAPVEAACRARALHPRSPLADPSAVQLLVPVVHALAAMQPLQGLRRVFDSLCPDDGFWLSRWATPDDWEHAAARELSERACGTLTEPKTLQRGIFEADAVKNLVEDHRRNISRQDRKILLLYALELWHRSHFD
jgi:asparagine synthase (glutamine-hydrolysing)